MAPIPFRLVAAEPRPAHEKKLGKSRLFATAGSRTATPRTTPKMAGIKRKSAGTSAPEIKDKSKKVKVDKSAAKSKSKHEVKPVKKAKKAKEESSDELDESDTSEQDNGFYGFSAADGEDVDMSDAESSEESEEQIPTSNGKAHKHKSEGDSSKKPKGDGADSKLAGLNGKTQWFLLSSLD